MLNIISRNKTVFVDEGFLYFVDEGFLYFVNKVFFGHDGIDKSQTTDIIFNNNLQNSIINIYFVDEGFLF